MPKYVMLIASAKIPTGKICDFSWPQIKLLPHHTTPDPLKIKAPPKNKN